MRLDVIKLLAELRLANYIGILVIDLIFGSCCFPLWAILPKYVMDLFSKIKRTRALPVRSSSP